MITYNFGLTFAKNLVNIAREEILLRGSFRYCSEIKKVQEEGGKKERNGTNKLEYYS